ncbi:MAG: hypothetical protein CMJ48_15110 [Planctomycetaceae bacterium]|nr:hypothetical protein [Planctomycetaceae bacterium]
MTEEQDQKRGWGFWVAVVVLLLLVAYPLSIGPVIWCLDTGRLPQSSVPAWEVFYAPVLWAWKNVPAAEHVLDWYDDLWHF